MKLKLISHEGTVVGYAFWCPGCKEPHIYYTLNWHGNPVWTFNGNIDQPTFSPSLRVRGGADNSHCHLFCTDGQLQFLNDCKHELKGQTVPVPEWPL